MSLLDGASQRGRRVYDIFDIIVRHVYVLEVMDVSTGVDRHIIIFVQNGHDVLLHVGALIFGLGGVGIDGMMANDHDPVFAGRLKGAVEPEELCLPVLLASIGIDGAVLAVTVDERCGVEEHYAYGCAVVLKHLSVGMLVNQSKTT